MEQEALLSSIWKIIPICSVVSVMLIGCVSNRFVSTVNEQLGKCEIQNCKKKTIRRKNELFYNYTIFIGKPEVQKQLERLNHRWEDNIKMDLQGIGYECVD
jgi:hypothetical protein